MVDPLMLIFFAGNFRENLCSNVMASTIPHAKPFIGPPPDLQQISQFLNNI